jgi:glucosamine--fructose-6-phosphate aminotransferase (isomerizing)
MLYLNAGDELTVSSKTYTSTLAALHGLAHLLTGKSAELALSELRRTADTIEASLPIWREQAGEIVEQVARKQFFVFLGRGPSQASAMTGALITKESAKLPTEGMNSGQYRHGPIEVTDDRIAVFIFAGLEPTVDLNLALAQELADLKAYVTVIGPVEHPGQNRIPVLHVPGESAWTLPIAEIVPVQLFAALLAEQRGLEAGKFRYIQKVTSRE